LHSYIHATLALTLAACPAPPPPASPSPPPPHGTVVDFEVHGPAPGAADPNGPPVAGGGEVVRPDRTLPQSPDIKLKLGHFTNARHNIGLVIDRTGKEARVRFDHLPQLLRLDPMPRSNGRIDYVRTINQVVLQVFDSGRVVVLVPNTTESIDVVRDGDADPL
jgi:hypothetical protein